MQPLQGLLGPISSTKPKEEFKWNYNARSAQLSLGPHLKLTVLPLSVNPYALGFEKETQVEELKAQ